MLFRQYELGCLSLYSYLVGDETTGRAVVVDPQRDIGGYLADADALGLRIERVIETHFHADFLSGHLELAAATGATVCFGEPARAEFPIETLHHHQRLLLGEMALEILSTPGHTPESISVVVYEHAGDPEPWGVLTGDALFVGDVGRPDLMASAGWTAEDLAARLYRSVHDQLMALPDGTRVFPAHGAGSACGKHMSTLPSSTIGRERATNYAVAIPDEPAFVASVTGGQPTAPRYFPFAAGANRHAHALLDDRLAPPALDVEAALDRAAAGAVLVDGRPTGAFVAGHLRGSVNVELDGRFAVYAGDVVRPGQEVVVVTEPGRETEARVRLARVGFDSVVGHLPDVARVLADRPDLSAQASRVTAPDLAAQLDDPSLQLVDVRTPSELEQGKIAGAVPLPLARLLDRLGELDPTAPTVVYCAGGQRSAVAASLLRAHGFTTVADLLGGFEAWCRAGLPQERA
jgi:hydroxyacylglutathione hydrolase